jgi:hypothetical protein
MKSLFRIAGAGALLALCAVGASAQTTVVLPDTSQSTTGTANVSEQCRLQVPTTITFPVTDVTISTPAPAASVTITSIVLATATKQLKISLQAAAANFTPPVVGATTWGAGDVSWNAAAWTNATGAGGVLSSTQYNEVATAVADTGGASTTALIFTLAAKATVKRAGNHTLSMTWKVESIGT